ncbi:MAG TPA: hypothetical protein VGD83_16675 [Streptosporangiaceae bacterium]
MTGDPAGPDIGADGLAELVQHYSHALAVAPSAAVYGELLSARSFAGTLLGRSSPRHRPDLTVTAGWLSSLLAISAADLGDHAAAVVWCTDTERHGRHASCPELLGWAALTRSLIAWYQGDPMASVAAACRGQADGQPGSVANAKLAAVAVDHPVLGGAVLLGGEQAGPACGLAASEQEDVGFLADLPDAELGIDCGQVGDQPVRMGLRGRWVGIDWSQVDQRAPSGGPSWRDRLIVVKMPLTAGPVGPHALSP